MPQVHLLLGSPRLHAGSNVVESRVLVSSLRVSAFESFRRGGKLETGQRVQSQAESVRLHATSPTLGVTGFGQALLPPVL